MKELLLIMIWAMLLFAPLLSHPLSLALSLIFTALTLSIFWGFWLSSWASIALSLVFLGGMMVVFLYFTSLVSSEKVIISYNPAHLTILSLTIFLGPIYLAPAVPIFSFAKLNFSWFNSGLLVFLVMYLLSSLVVVVELTSSFKGSLESGFY